LTEYKIRQSLCNYISELKYLYVEIYNFYSRITVSKIEENVGCYNKQLQFYKLSLYYYKYYYVCSMNDLQIYGKYALLKNYFEYF
jgi:hypothetical protein